MPTINGAGSKYGFSNQNFSGTGKWANCIVVRAKDASSATQIASLMNSIIRQSQSGKLSYSQDNRSSLYNKGLGNGMTSADCSSAVSWIVRQVTGNSTFNTATGTGKSMANALYNTGAFMNAFNYVDGVSTPLCTGDIIIYANGGHCAVVTDGTGRSGADWELYAGNYDYSRGYSANWADYSSEFGGFIEGEYEPRMVEPIIEPEEEYLPEEIIELIELGEISKEELEEEYDMYYIYEGRGGYSPFGNIPLNNKTYAWNRFAEILGMQESCPLPKGDPGGWVAEGGGGFVCDMAPELGAVMCFVNQAGGEGYACIVEAIYADEILITGQYEDGHLTFQERYKRYGAWDFDTYMFTGFIHNPAAWMGAEDESALETFLRIAEEQVGEGREWVVQQTGIIGPRGWSAAFIVACSKRAGSSLNIVIPNVDSVSTIGRVGVLRGMGTWHKGATYDGGYEPSAGDIVIFRYEHTGKESIYHGDKAGIVVESDGGNFEAVVGDDNNHVTKKGYSAGSHFIAGYFSPNWSSIDGTTASKKEYRNIQGLYTNGVTKYDACARTVGYINSQYKPSISKSHVKLAAVNYTGLLANFYSVFGQAGISTATNSELVVDFWTNTVRSYYQQMPGDFDGVSGDVLDITSLLASGLTSSLLTDSAGLPQSTFYNSSGTIPTTATATDKEILSYLVNNHGLTEAAAVGVLANIKRESANAGYAAAYNANDSGDGPSGGIFQWHNSKKYSSTRFTDMKAWVEKATGGSWTSSWQAQIDYAFIEMNNNKNYYSSVLNAINSSNNTAASARQVAEAWSRVFEGAGGKSGSIATEARERGDIANGLMESRGG